MAGSRCLLSGVGAFVGREWSKGSSVGFAAAGEEAHRVAHWEGSDCSWVRPERLHSVFHVSRYTKGEQHREAGPLASWKKERADFSLSFLLPLPSKASSQAPPPLAPPINFAFHNLGASWVPGPGQLLRASVVTSYRAGHCVGSQGIEEIKSRK